MAMFAIVASIAVLTMMFVPTTGPAFATLGAPAQVQSGTTHSELPIRESDLACQGQTWGDEDEDCLVKIAMDSGKGDRVKVRRLASAEPVANAPNIF